MIFLPKKKQFDKCLQSNSIVVLTSSVHSYKGGAGKSILSINLGGLYSSNHKVLVVETDFSMPSYNQILDISPRYYLNDYFNKEVPFDDLLTSNENLSNLDLVVCNPRYNPEDQLYSIDPEQYSKFYRKLKESIASLDYDLILFDLGPGTSLMNGLVVSLAEVVNIVLRFDKISLSGTLKMIKEFYNAHSLLKQKKVNVIINQIPKVEGVELLLKEWKREFEILISKDIGFSTIYYDPRLALESANGTVFYDESFDLVNGLASINII